MNQIKAILCLCVIVVLWPLCAMVWVIQWPIVKFMNRSPKSPGPRISGKTVRMGH